MNEGTGVGLLTKILLTAPVVIAMAAVGAMLWWVATSENSQQVNLQSAVSQLEDPTISAPDGKTGATGEDGAEDTTGQSANAGDTPVDTTEGNGASDTTANGSSKDAATTDASSIIAESENSTLTDINGVWNLDTSIVEYDFEEDTGSFAGFIVDEVLTHLGKTTAVGRTGDVHGTITIVDNVLQDADVTVGMQNLVTDIPFRDRKMHLALQTDEFPEATFKLIDPVPWPDRISDDNKLTAQANGDLIIANRRNSTVFDLEAQIMNGVIVITGSSNVVFKDYKIETPKAPVVISVEDHGIIEFRLFFTRNTTQLMSQDQNTGSQ